MFKEYYNNVATYLTDTFGANFIFLTILITSVVSIAYFIVLSYLITQLDTRYFMPKSKVLTNMSDNTVESGNANKNNSLISINGGLNVIIGMSKIILGIVLLLCGLAMLVLPGQGLITILIALSLIPFPGKHKLELYLLSHKSVRSSLNWIRLKAHKEPFIFD